MDSARKTPCRREQAAALIIVLALIVLVTGLVVAYFSRATSDRPVANSSFNQSKVDQLAQSAMDNVIGDLRQEIVNGSVNPAPTFGPASSPLNLYVPTTSSNILPVRSPIQAGIPNLIRRSVSPDTIPAPARASRASAVNSYSDVSANGRSVTLARWNSHYLIPKANPGDDGTEPITTGFNLPNYWAPDWVYVNNNGVTIITQPDNSIIGRYTYMMYDEGGLLDLNAAGYPSPTTILQYGRKGSLAFADLTTVPAAPSTALPASQVDNIVGWRNYASSQPSGSLSSNLTFSTNATNTYYNFILSDSNYIQLRNYFTSSPLTYFTNFFLKTAWQAPQYNSQTDQGFTTRQQLIAFRKTTGFSSNALQYLGTLSREALASVPQWSPTTPDSINPNFQTLWVTAPFTRNDGTTAYVGDYLVSPRFLLQRLNWLTYKGPSASRNPVPTSAPAVGSADYDLWLLTRTNGITFGLTSTFLQDPVTGGTDANILKNFGLAWDTTNERWNYVGHGGSSTPIDSIATLGSITGTREPDFFELLRAGILSGSIGDSVTSYPELPTAHQQSQMLHILAIGANLIAQSRVDSYPVRIACTVNVGGTPTIMEAVGVPRLPCINSLAACPVGVTANSGGMNWLLVPNLWDPFRDTWDLTEASTGNTGNGPNLTPGYLRPPVRTTIRGTGGGGSGTIGFATAATVTNSGRIGPVSAFSSVTFNSSSQLLQTGQVVTPGSSILVGRDGFLEAMRMGISDMASSLGSAFNTATLGSVTPSWNDVVRPTNDTSSLRSDHFAVFRISANIPAGTTGFPVLILFPGFQIEMEYQSPTDATKWYAYSFLQGNNATNTWISSNLNIATNYSEYRTPPGNTAPTIVKAGTTSTVTRWDTGTGGVAALAQAPMFAKADPRSIRYNSQIGTLTLSSSAGVIGSIWPSGYTSAPALPPGTNPATYSQTTGDNAPAGSNPYSESPPASETDFTHNDPVRPVMMNRPFRSVGEIGYAFRDQPFRTLGFSSASSPDAGLLDLFTTIAYGPTPTPSPSPSITPTYPTPTATPRGGVINLNSLQTPALAAVLASTITKEKTPRQFTGGAPSPTPTTLTVTQAKNVATSLVSSTSSAPIVNRTGLANLIASETGLGPTVPKTQRESIARALGEADQTRTWNLLMDVIAQSGRYPPNATNLQNGFVVEGEQRYWVHVAIDRFTGQVIDKQIEVVNE